MNNKINYHNKKSSLRMKDKKNKLKILIRTAGGRERKQELGLGHVYRTLNLAEEMKPNKIHFLLEDFGGAKKIISQKGFKNIQTLDKKIKLKNDVKITVDYIKKEKIDLMIVDRYHVKLNYLKKVKEFVKLIVISDLDNIDYPADLIINGYIGFKNQIKINSYNSKCLLGPKYQILDKRFSIKNVVKNRSYDLLVSVGGYDDKGTIDKILKCIHPHLSQIKTKIIVGPVGQKSEMSKKLEKKYPNNLKIINFSKNMKREMNDVKFAICGGGITSYEFASLNKPFGIICVEKHQVKSAQQWEKKGRALNFGMMTKSNENKINEFIQNIANNKSPLIIKNKTLVDGKGVIRVTQEILKIRL